MNEMGNREERLFNQAMELPTAEARAAFLKEACGGDEELRQRLEALLAAAQPTNDFLEHAPGAPTFLSASPAQKLPVSYKYVYSALGPASWASSQPAGSSGAVRPTDKDLTVSSRLDSCTGAIRLKGKRSEP